MPTPDRRSDDLRNITRVDYGASKGWVVRFQRSGEKVSQFFSDGRHGGADDALDAARAWRDEQRQRLGPVRQDASQMHTPEARRRNRRSVSRTGTTGIGFAVREFANERVPYVTAYWLDEGGRRRMTSFSVQEHGLRDALGLAARARIQTSDWHGEPERTAPEIAEATAAPVRRLIAEAGFDPADYTGSAVEGRAEAEAARREARRQAREAERAERAEARRQEREARRVERAEARRRQKEARQKEREAQRKKREAARARQPSKLDVAVSKAAATLQTCGVADPDLDLLRAITAGLGPSAFRRDRQRVACSDPKELDRVRKSYLRNKLGLGRDEAEGSVEAVCEQMAPAGSHKLRVAFYYLLVKRHRKESVYGG